MEIKGKTEKKIACVAMLVDQFEKSEPTKMRIDGYMIGLSDLTDEATEAATVRLLHEWKGMRAPAPADIIEAATGTTKADLDREVGEVVEALEYIFRVAPGGTNNSFVFPARIMWVIQYLGGIVYLGGIEDEAFDWLRKKDIPEALRICPQRPDIDVLPGRWEQSHDSARWTLIDRVHGTQKLIGDGVQNGQIRLMDPNERIGEGSTPGDNQASRTEDFIAIPPLPALRVVNIEPGGMDLDPLANRTGTAGDSDAGRGFAR